MTTNNSQIPSCLSQEDVDYLVSNPGQTLTNGVAQSQVIQAQRTVDISAPAAKGVRPQIGGHISGAERITVSPNLAKRLAEGDAVIRDERAKQQAEEEAQKAAVEETSADKVLARLNYLERTVKAQAKQLKELQK